MTEVLASALTPGLVAELRRLTHAAYGGAFTGDDLAHALGGEHVVVRDEQGRWLAHAAVVPRRLVVGDRALRAGFVEAVAVLPAMQSTGLGQRVMVAAGALIRQRHDLGALSTGDHGFYARLGWERWRGPSWIMGDDGVLRRSEDEDDGIMVLRTPASRDLDATLPIACHDRPGDAW